MNVPNNKPFAEVIESSLDGLLAQSWKWDRFPTFGSLVSIQNNGRTIFGIVHKVQTGSMDPVRYPFPYQKTQEELMREQPQIFEFLKTTFSCLTVGYYEKGRITYALAPEPAKIHSFVSPTPQDISKQFFANQQYIHLIFGGAHQVTNIDELLLALIRHFAQLGIASDSKIQTFMQTYTLLTGNDYRRTKLFLQRAEHILI